MDRERCVIEGVVDGLTPGAHGLAIHETGDVSRFYVFQIYVFCSQGHLYVCNFWDVTFPTLHTGVALVWVDISIQEAPDMGPLSSMKTKDMWAILDQYWIVSALWVSLKQLNDSYTGFHLMTKLMIENCCFRLATLAMWLLEKMVEQISGWQTD